MRGEETVSSLVGQPHEAGGKPESDAPRASAACPARRIYVASSWRNDVQPHAVALFRALGNEVYDFKNPRPGDNGFHWSEIDPEWLGWKPDELMEVETNG